MARSKRQKQNTRNPKIPTRILRIVYDDPDATDEEDVDFEKPKKVKRIVHEVPLPPMVDETSSESCVELNKVETGKIKRQSSCKYRGVRMRKWGSWAAEIRNPKVKSGREWLGTFSTPEEASQAYEKRYVEIREEMAKADEEKRKCSNNSNNNVAIATTPQNFYFVSSDGSESDMSHTSLPFLRESNGLDFNLIESGNVSSNEANVLGGEFADLGGEFRKLDMPDLSVLDMPLPSPPPLPPLPDVGATNPSGFEFDCLTFDNFWEGCDDLGGVEDSTIDDEGPIELPDFDFDFDDFGADEITGWLEEPLNIPCV